MATKLILNLENFNWLLKRVNYDVTQIPICDTVEGYISEHYPHLYEQYIIVKLKRVSLPDKQKFPGKLNERNVSNEKRKLTRPWDMCWFSNKPHIISLTVEEAIEKYPDYMLWCYKNLSIKWSTHTIKLFNKFT
jgi:hypothetical protein